MSLDPIWRLAAEYGAYAVWRRYPDGGLDNLDPSKLDLSSSLREGLAFWTDVYDSTFDPSDPSRSGFKSELEELLFSEVGRYLAKHLAESLGEPVQYFDRSERRYEIVEPRRPSG